MVRNKLILTVLETNLVNREYRVFIKMLKNSLPRFVSLKLICNSDNHDESLDYIFDIISSTEDSNFGLSSEDWDKFTKSAYFSVAIKNFKDNTNTIYLPLSL